MRKMMIAIGLATLCGPVAAEDPTVTRSVRYSDLNLMSDHDIRRLTTRVKSAARLVCLREQQPTPAPPPVDRACYTAAMSGAAKQIERVVARAQRTAAAEHPADSSLSTIRLVRR